MTLASVQVYEPLPTMEAVKDFESEFLWYSLSIPEAVMDEK
jgi:hypothetical protein